LMGYTELNFYVFSIHGRWMDYFHRMSTHGRLALGSSSIFSIGDAATATFFFILLVGSR
jgi:hypothetical protein